MFRRLLEILHGGELLALEPLTQFQRKEMHVILFIIGFMVGVLAAAIAVYKDEN